MASTQTVGFDDSFLNYMNAKTYLESRRDDRVPSFPLAPYSTGYIKERIRIRAIVVVVDAKTLVIIAGPYEQLTPVAYSDNTGHFPLTIGLLLLGFGIGAAVGAGASIITQGLTNGWDNINWWQVLLDAGIGGISGALSFSGIGASGMAFASCALGFAGSVGGDLIANKGDPASINRGKAVAMGLVNFALGRVGGAGVQNKAEIGETLLRVSSSYKAVMTATARYGAKPKFRSTWNLWGGRLLFDAALALPSILAGRMYSATSTMAYHTLITIAFSWAADSWIDWW